MVAADLWLPTQINPNGNERKNHTYGIVARLKPGVTMAQALAEMVMIGQRLEQQYLATNSGWGVRVFPMAKTADNHWIVSVPHIMVLGPPGKALGYTEATDPDPNKPYMMWAAPRMNMP
jgi:hypothetical protein